MRRSILAGALVLAAGAAPAAAAASSPVAIEHRTLVVRGGAQADAIALEVPRSRPHVLRVDGHEVKRSRFDRIRVESGAGDDEVRVAAADLEPLRYDGGDGFDQIVAEGSNAGERYELSTDDGVVRVEQDRVRITADAEAVETFGRGGADTVDVGALTGSELQSVVVELGTVRGFESADRAQDRVTVEGTAASDQIVAFGTSDFVSVFGTPETVSIANPDPSDRLTIDGRRGDDTIMAQSEALTQVVDGGDGDDGVSAAAGDDVLIGGDGDDELFGAGGDDVVEGGSGDDALAVDGTDAAERIDLTAGGRRLDVELGTDDLDVDDVETIDALALGGADTITVGDLRRTDVERVNPALSADGAPDRVVVTGTERRDAIAVAGQAGSVTVTGLAAFVGITEAEPLDTLAIHTAAGDDAVDSSGLAPGVIGLDVE